MKMKKPIKIEHLVNWYFGNLAYKYEDVDKQVYNRIKEIVDKLKVDELTHKEFAMIMKENLDFKGIKKELHDCEICRKLGIR